MAKKLTTITLSSMLARTVGSLRPYEVGQLSDALNRINYARGGGDEPTTEPTLTVISASIPANSL